MSFIIKRSYTCIHAKQNVYTALLVMMMANYSFKHKEQVNRLTTVFLLLVLECMVTHYCLVKLACEFFVSVKQERK